MAFQLIGAALGGVQLISGLFGQRSQARAQEEQLKAQADSIKTQEHLTKLQIEQQRQLSESNLRLEQRSLQSQQTIGLLQIEAEEAASRVNAVQQGIQLDQKKFADEQRAILADSQAALQRTGELAQLAQLADQSAGMTNELAGVIDQRQLREGGRGDATVGTNSDLNALEREALTVGDNVQQSQQLVGQGISLANLQQEYENALSSGLLDLDTLQNSELADSLQRAIQSDALQSQGSRADINIQADRNARALESAYATELAQLATASTSADVQSAAQQRAVGAQSRGIQRPGLVGTLSALGNTALGFYDAIGSANAQRPPRAQASPPTPPIWAVPASSPSIGGAVRGLIPSASSPSVRTNPGAAALGLVPGGNSLTAARGLVPGLR